MDHRMHLTDEQRQLVHTAVEEGYFRVPRETTLVDLAEKHGISSVEASEQLRVGIDSILRETNIGAKGGD